MVDPTLPPCDDHLLERLAALGPVLDDLAAEAAGGDAPPPAPGSPGLRRAPRNRRATDRRRRAIAALALVLALAAGIAVLVIGRDDQTVTTDQTTTTTQVQPSPEVANLAANRVENIKTCGPVPTKDDWPMPWPDGWTQVMAADCDLGWIPVDAEAVQPIPVYPTAEVGAPKAYWSPSTGWITLDEYDDPDFDIAEYRAAFQAATEASGRSDPAGDTGN